MKKRTKLLLTILLTISGTTFAQIGDYSEKREISGITEKWHALELPTSVYNGLSDNLSDLRIYGVSTKDTIEAPYLLNVKKEKHVQKEVVFSLINTASRANTHYFTFEVPTTKTLNEILLNFKNENFDWKVKLEGSQEQSKWFTILDDSRILSIKNEQTDYRFSHLKFPNSKYRYYRISFKSDVAPKLLDAKIYLHETIEAQYNMAEIGDYEISRNKKKKQTIVQIALKQRQPISFLNLDIPNDYDYYRSFQVQYAQDSVPTDKGIKFTYRTLFRGTLNSIEKNEFNFNSVMAKNLRIIIDDHDNQPLNITNMSIKGYKHYLTARFTDKRDYFLVYGNINAQTPNYDIVHTSKSIPTSLIRVDLGPEIHIPKNGKEQIAPLFENKIWLWSVMAIVILVIGGFTLKMMSKKES